MGVRLTAVGVPLAATVGLSAGSMADSTAGKRRNPVRPVAHRIPGPVPVCTHTSQPNIHDVPALAYAPID
ncbi:hypothetical protein GCM10011579_091690 [Streptomyces albiflavescens]|uniref:Uncharacterized protein n=1 Tax=Streptomyces albiflavescens TaxID=1623582 RepID=A0A917YH72_9ACTN|nr:hypothetical protein GCM10011579_091690 [Streptomyces albiflavescens]